MDCRRITPENDVPSKLSGIRRVRRSSPFEARGDPGLLLVRLQPLLLHDNRTASDGHANQHLWTRIHHKEKVGQKEAVGKVKEETGKAIGNQDLHHRGTAEKLDGKVERKVGDVKKVFGK